MTPKHSQSIEEIIKEFEEEFAIDGKWIDYPWNCKHNGITHQHTDGYVCHHDDGYFCKDRMKHLEAFLKSKLMAFEKEIREETLKEDKECLRHKYTAYHEDCVDCHNES